MYKIVFYLIFFSASLCAYIDDDMDGVPNSDDKCANTPLTDLVDLSGCTIEKLVAPKHHFDIVLGQSYSKESNSSLNLSSIRLDYYYQAWSFQLATSYYKSKFLTQTDTGQTDTYLNLFYLVKPFKNFYLNIGGGIVLPTYDSADNKIDYTASLYGHYKWDKLSLILGAGYGKIGDSNSENIISYNNTLSYNTGLGYSWNSKLYTSIGYAKVNSIFEGYDDLETLSFYTYYGIDEHWFSNLNYQYELRSNNGQKTIGVNLGYYW